MMCVLQLRETALVGILLAVVGWSWSVAGCGARSVGASGDATTSPDVGSLDGGNVCDDVRLQMGFVWETAVLPTSPEPDLERFELSGEVVYSGAITEPIATSPQFDSEVQILHADGQVSVVQYYLPPAVALPVQEGWSYTFWLYRRMGFEGYAVGLVIDWHSSGVPPLIFVGDPGSYGRVFPAEHPAVAPLRVYLEPWDGCPPQPDQECGGHRYLDRLLFDSSTGGVVSQVVVAQGQGADLEVLGAPWRVVNLASSHVDQPCLDSPAENVAYLGVNVAHLPAACDKERFYVWDDPNAFGLGSYCDELYVCPDSAEQAAMMEAVSPDLVCGQPVAACAPDGLGCLWFNSGEVTQAVYDQLCAVSVLPDPPDRIQCSIYFY